MKSESDELSFEGDTFGKMILNKLPKIVKTPKITLHRADSSNSHEITAKGKIY